jgi:hypothetical protein
VLRLGIVVTALITGLALGAHIGRTAPVQGEPPCHENPNLVGPCLRIRGVLRPWNGTPTYRISRLGAKRILGIEEWSKRLAGYCGLPQYLRDTIEIGHKEILADFVVCPLTKSRPSVMQMVCVDSATHIVTRHSLFFIPN